MHLRRKERRVTGEPPSNFTHKIVWMEGIRDTKALCPVEETHHIISNEPCGSVTTVRAVGFEFWGRVRVNCITDVPEYVAARRGKEGKRRSEGNECVWITRKKKKETPKSIK
jgi:hypothetical protein